MPDNDTPQQQSGKPRPDFINIRISDAALKLLGTDAQVRAIGGSMDGSHDYTFNGSVPREILRTEWRQLRDEHMHDGTHFFQEA